MEHEAQRVFTLALRPVRQQGDRLGPRNGGAKFVLLQDFGKRGRGKEMTAAQLVAFADDVEILHADRPVGVDRRAEFTVAQDVVSTRVAARHQRGAVGLGDAQINRVMTRKPDTVGAQLPERGRQFRRDTVRAQSIPHHHNNMFGIAGRVTCSRKAQRAKSGQQTTG